MLIRARQLLKHQYWFQHPVSGVPTECHKRKRGGGPDGEDCEVTYHQKKGEDGERELGGHVPSEKESHIIRKRLTYHQKRGGAGERGLMGHIRSKKESHTIRKEGKTERED